ncbi:MAG: hypothetical protein LBN93_00460 [Candidatus Symbiothrix sp.]|jgi:hypothetical protein|nr:hypothetical protein [Candidatus Symbiothrix sp.]
MKMFKFIKISLVFFVLLFGCTKKTHQSSYFEQRDTNIAACVSAMIAQGIDSIEAEELCPCLLDVAYSMDSTFITLTEQERQDFLRIHEDKIKFICDSLRTTSTMNP